jgi:hypothetical protein
MGRGGKNNGPQQTFHNYNEYNARLPSTNPRSHAAEELRLANREAVAYDEAVAVVADYEASSASSASAAAPLETGNAWFADKDPGYCAHGGETLQYYPECGEDGMAACSDVKGWIDLRDKNWTAVVEWGDYDTNKDAVMIKCLRAWETRVPLTTPAGDDDDADAAADAAADTADADDDDDADGTYSENQKIIFAAVLFAIVCAILVFS